MGETTSIEWTASFIDGKVVPGASWNPIVAYHRETGKRGWFCVHASEGCRNCYAERLNLRLGNGLAYTAQNLEHVRFELAPKFDQPMKWKRPRKIFVDSMFDPFLDAINFGLLDPVFAVMAESPEHTFLLLTKNPKRMRLYVSDPQRPYWIAHSARTMGWRGSIAGDVWPLPNVWLGVSTERQKEANERIPELLKTPAAKRFISYEPALGPVDIKRIQLSETLFLDARYGTHSGHISHAPLPPKLPGLNWAISGAESGPGARPSDVEWFRAMKNDCADTYGAVAYFHKQEVRNGYKISTPTLDGQQWVQFPA
jgi:protein gp37